MTFLASFYVDTSALVKRYLPEIGSAWVRSLCSTQEIIISSLSVTELASTLARRVREGGLATTDGLSIYRQFLADTKEYVVLGLSMRIVREAATLLLVTPGSINLRSLDALHLASARTSRARAMRSGLLGGSFVTSDRRLSLAAAAMGLDVVNPEDVR